jgi:hypothetical protein
MPFLMPPMTILTFEQDRNASYTYAHFTNDNTSSI